MQSSSITRSDDSDSEYIPQDDESELKRINSLRGGSGEVILTDDDIKAYSLNDFGLSESHQFPENMRDF